MILKRRKTILNILKYVFPLIFLAAGAAFLPERLAKSVRIRVLTLDSDRAELIEKVAGIPAQIRWLELVQWPFEVMKKAPK